jgi:Ca2+-binding RTX toxin-like protein
MTTLTVTADTDYTIAPFNAQVLGQSIDAITFATSGFAFALFETSQFGGSNIANTILITGNAQQNNIYVSGNAGMTSFSAAGWTFSNWSNADSIYFEDAAGDQLWTGSSQRDYFYDRLGNDTYLGGEGFDTFFFDVFGTGSGGNDSVNGGNGTDSVNYESQTLGVVVNLALGTATGAGIGSDILVSIEQAFGGDGNDSLTGDASVNALFGGMGNDTLDGGAGSDDLSGGDGDDTYYVDVAGESVNEYNANVATGGYDTVFSSTSTSLSPNCEKLVLTGNSISGVGNAGDNVVDARTVNNTVNVGGGAGNDLVYGSAFNDLVYGGTGSDTLIGGAGADQFYGEDSNNPASSTDFVSFETAQSAVVADLKPPASGGSVGTGTVGDAAGDTYRGIEGFIGSNFNDKLYGADIADSIYGGGGADTIDGRDGHDYLDGGAGDDVLFGRTGNDTMSGGSGSNYLYGGSGSNSLNGGENLDIFVSEGSIDLMTGGDGTNYFYRFAAGYAVATGGAGQDIYVGGSFASNDTFQGFGGDDYAQGGDGDDLLEGGFNNDILLGGNGNDTLDGGNGINYLYMDGGNDQARVVASGGGTQLLVGFDAGGANDSVRLVSSSLTSFADYQALLANLGSVVNGNLLQNTGAGALLTLNLGQANQTDIWFLGTLGGGITAADISFI